MQARQPRVQEQTTRCSPERTVLSNDCAGDLWHSPNAIGVVHRPNYPLNILGRRDHNVLPVLLPLFPLHCCAGAIYHHNMSVLGIDGTAVFTNNSANTGGT